VEEEREEGVLRPRRSKPRRVIVGEGWVVREGSERTLVEMSQGVAGPILAFLSAEQVFNPSKVRELDSMPAPKDMVAWLRQHPYLRTSDPQAAAVGGVEGVRLDAVVASVPPTKCGGIASPPSRWATDPTTGGLREGKTALRRVGKRRRQEGHDSGGSSGRRLRGVLA
jgi:hypothetical protein